MCEVSEEQGRANGEDEQEMVVNGRKWRWEGGNGIGPERDTRVKSISAIARI